MSPAPRRIGAVAVVGLLAVPAMLPLLTVVASWASPAGEIWQHQLQYVLPRVATNTAALLLIVGLATAALGAGLGWLVAAHDFPGRALFTWGLLLPLAVPGYVLAVVFAGALDYAGPLQTWLRESTPWMMQLPPIRSLGGAALVLTLCLYPYVYLLARVAFESGGARALEAAQALGLDRGAAFRRALLPLARPAVAAGVGLVCMETLADFGVVAALNVDTFTTAIYRAWFGLFSLQAALQMAAMLGLLALAGAWLEQHLRGGRRFATGRSDGGLLPRQRLHGMAAVMATATATTVLLLAFVLPMAQLLAWAARHAATDLDARYWAFAGRSVAIAASGALVVVAASLLLRYALRAETRNWVQGLGRIATVGYAIPGTVLAVGLFVPVAALGGLLQSWLDGLYGASAPQLFLQGTLLTMFIAYLARFMAVGSGPVESGLARIAPNLDEAAANLGVRGLARLPPPQRCSAEQHADNEHQHAHAQ